MVAQCCQDSNMDTVVENQEWFKWYHSGYPNRTVAQDPERSISYNWNLWYLSNRLYDWNCDICPTVSSSSHPHAPIPILLSPYSHPKAPIPTSCPYTPIIMLLMLLYFSCGVVMILGWEYGDGSVRISTPPWDPIPNTPVQMLPLLCSYPTHLPALPSTCSYPHAPIVMQQTVPSKHSSQ